MIMPPAARSKWKRSSGSPLFCTAKPPAERFRLHSFRTYGPSVGRRRGTTGAKWNSTRANSYRLLILTCFAENHEIAPGECSLPLVRDPLLYRDTIVYQVQGRSSHDSNGDGTGYFKGLEQKLDHL